MASLQNFYEQAVFRIAGCVEGFKAIRNYESECNSSIRNMLGFAFEINLSNPASIVKASMKLNAMNDAYTVASKECPVNAFVTYFNKLTNWSGFDGSQCFSG